MKMKNIFKSWSLAAITGLMVVTTACDTDFEETNTDPNSPTEISVDLQLGYIERTLVNEVHNYFAAGECASDWPQHISKPIYNDADRYYPRLGSINNFWTIMYASVIADANEMYNLAVEAENPAVQGAALTLQAIAYQYLTDAFGSIPMSDAIKGEEGNFNATYDSQEQVYTQIFAMLDEAIASFQAGGSINAGQDLMYGGDTSKWLKLATSIKFRAMMRISDTSLFSASELQSLVNSGNLITTNADNAFISFETIATPNANPFYAIVLDGRTGEWCMGEALVEFMKTANDPRLAVYANPNDSGEYRGKPAGYINPGSAGYATGTVSEIGDAFMAADAPLQIINAAQVNLLLADAAASGYIGGAAADYFSAGVASSLTQHGLSATSFTPSYQGPQSIGEQLWVSTFMQGYETWAEWRRTDIPGDLPLAVDPQPGVNSIPTRYTYPNDEISLNASNVNAALEEQNIDDALTAKVWWDVN